MALGLLLGVPTRWRRAMSSSVRAVARSSIRCSMPSAGPPRGCVFDRGARCRASPDRPIGLGM